MLKKEIVAIGKQLRINTEIFIDTENLLISNQYCLFKFSNEKDYISLISQLKLFKKITISDKHDLLREYNKINDINFYKFKINNQIWEKKFNNEIVINKNYNELHSSRTLDIKELLKIYKIDFIESCLNFDVNIVTLKIKNKSCNFKLYHMSKICDMTVYKI